jgi:UDP-glucose 4-epimerase
MMELKGKTILVIGGAGFIGSHLVDQLIKEEPKEIRIYDNFTRGTYKNLENALKHENVNVFDSYGDITHVDLLDKAMEGVDCVFLLAALWLLHCQEYQRSAFDVNVKGTFNVLEACVKHKVEKLIYSSSASVYGDAVEVPMTEDHPFNNKTFYGATKIACEAMCTAYHHRFDLPVLGLRYMNVYGPRQDYKGAYIAVIMRMLDRIYSGKPPILHGDGSQAFDFVFVKDVARANICAMKSDAKHGFYNVGTQVQTTIKELSQIILKVTGSDLEIEYQPAPKDQSLVKNRIGSKKKAIEEIDFEYSVDVEDGIRQVVEWYKKIRNL